MNSHIAKPIDIPAMIATLTEALSQILGVENSARVDYNRAEQRILIIATAAAFTKNIKTARNAGTNSHIAKPIDIPAMLATLTEALSQILGVENSARIDYNRAGQRILIIATAAAFTKNIKTARNAGTNSHIAKPIDIPAMLATLT